MRGRRCASLGIKSGRGERVGERRAGRRGGVLVFARDGGRCKNREQEVKQQQT